MQSLQAASDSVHKTFPIVSNSAIRVGEKITLKIPRRAKPDVTVSGVADNEATRMIKDEIEKQLTASKLEEETRARIVESIINDHTQHEMDDSIEHISALRKKQKKKKKRIGGFYNTITQYG